jgi:ParB family chromosome partitioning protein
MANQQIAVESRQVKLIGLDKVTEGEFAISYPLQVPLLVESVREVGLIRPLLVVLRNGAYEVVCGQRRLAACRELGYTNIACRFLPDQSPLRLLELAIQDNLTTRSFNPLEKANIICKLLKYLPKEEVICRCLPYLGLQPHHKVLDRFLNLAKLEERVKQAVVSGRVHEEIAGQLAKWPAADQIRLADMFIDIPFSVSSQQEVITNIWEISQREEIPLAAVLTSAEIEGWLNDSSLNGSRKGYNIRRYLSRRRYPRLSHAESRFKQRVSRLHLPQGTKLVPPAHFETSKFKLEIGFTSPDQLKQSLSALSETTQNPAWRDIFKLGIEHDP